MITLIICGFRCYLSGHFLRVVIFLHSLLFLLFSLLIAIMISFTVLFHCDVNYYAAEIHVLNCSTWSCSGQTVPVFLCELWQSKM